MKNILKAALGTVVAVAMMQGVYAADAKAAAPAAAGDKDFAAADTNKDGAIVVEEYVVWFKAAKKGTDDKAAKDAFAKADKNGDKKLDKGEFGAACGSAAPAPAAPAPAKK
jgi:hypothetical protein